jgi:HK97 family phage portal protein
MRLFDAAFERRDATFTLKDPAIQALRDWFGAGTSAAGVNVSQASAEGIPVVFACNRLISDLIADAPLKVFRLLERGKEPAKDHRLYSILHDLSNPMMSAHDFKFSMQWNLGLWGNAYAFVERYPQGDIKALWPLLPEKMKVGWDKLQRLTYEYGSGANKEKWVWDTHRPPIFHLRCYSRDGIHGRSPITVLRESFGEAQAARHFSASFWADGALGTIFFSHPSRLKPQAKENLRDSLKQKFGRGTETGHAIGVLEEGVKVERLTMPAKDAQFLELREYHIEDLARIFGVPPFLVGLTQKSTSWGTGLQEQVLGMLKFTGRPWMGRWEQSVARDLLTFKSFETHRALFVLQALERADLATRIAAYERQIRIGMLSPNEGRALEDRNPREGGDEYVMVNTIGVGMPVKTDESKGAAPSEEE